MSQSTSASWQIDVAAETTVIDALLGETGLSAAKIKEALIKGAVWVKRNRSARVEKARRVRRAKNTVQAGDQLFMYYNPKILALEVKAPTLIEDRDFYSIWDKPAGMLCEGSRWSDHCALTRMASKKVLADRACFLVHRLDKMTSGLILLAHSKKAAHRLSQLFAARQVEKHYQALVRGFSPEQSAQLPLTIDEALDGKAARTIILAVKPARRLLNGSLPAAAHAMLEQMCELEVKIETGRTHQIRRHLQGFGSPVIGDRLYGADSREIGQLAGLQLRACRIAFADPFDDEHRSWELK